MDPSFDPGRAALFTDLYEVTMAQAYLAEGLTGRAVFELFFRRLPPSRNFIVAAGLNDVLDYFEQLRFQPGDLDYLRSLSLFSEGFLGALAELRFTGDVWAVPEGTIVFPNEPLLQVVAPIVEAQLAETFVLNQVHFQSVLAAKAARLVTAARGRTVVDFGSRRAHGFDAALKAARSAYLVGATGTSNLLAGRLFGIPTFGTMAHSYIQAHDDERSAFEAFSRLYPGSTLLVDTYDSLEGTAEVARLLTRDGDPRRVRGIRLDSGELGVLSRAARAILDGAGLHHVQIFASSELDERKIEELLARGAPIDGFGVGTQLALAADAPALDMAYKLVEYAGAGRTKLSAQKVIYPGRKQVFREEEGGLAIRDVIGRFDEKLPGRPLLAPVIARGQRLPGPSLAEARQAARFEHERLPAAVRSLEPLEAGYPVAPSAALAGDLEALRRQHRRGR